MSNLLPFPRRTVDEHAFAEATSRLAGVVAIVTWHWGLPGGLLVSTVSLLSTRPGRVLFGASKDDPSHDVLLGVEHCALNLLAETDEDEARRFGLGAAHDRFPTDRWRIDPGLPPRLRAGAVHLSGAIDYKIDAGSHSLFVVRVDAIEINDREPLVSFDHGFRRLAQPSGAARA